MEANDTQQASRRGRDEHTPRGPRKLLRSREDRVIGGVCGGLGRYFNVDPILFRIGIAVLALRGRRRAAALPRRPPADPERAGRAGRRADRRRALRARRDRRGGAARSRLALSTRRWRHRCGRSRAPLSPRYHGCSRMVARRGRRTLGRAARHRAASGARRRNPHPVVRDRARRSDSFGRGRRHGGGHRADPGGPGHRRRRVRAPRSLAHPARGAAGSVRRQRRRRRHHARRRCRRAPLPPGVHERPARPATSSASASWTSTSATSIFRPATRRSRSTWASATCGWRCRRTCASRPGPTWAWARRGCSAARTPAWT